jgi:hypothetical protein
VIQKFLAPKDVDQVVGAFNKTIDQLDRLSSDLTNSAFDKRRQAGELLSAADTDEGQSKRAIDISAKLKELLA